MKLSGVAELPLHWGKAPRWLFERMVNLGRCVTEIIIHEYGINELLRRLSNPFWFQAYSCVLGWDWHSSGSTTVVMAVLKKILNPEEYGIAVTGGKGNTSRKTLEEIEKIGDIFNLSTRAIKRLTYASRMAAKVDNTLIQANYPLYHHCFIFTENKKWSVVQQGFNTENRTARRYHWFSEHVKSFVKEPHDAIVCDVKREKVLNMTAKKSGNCRKLSLDLVKDNPEKIKRDFARLSLSLNLNQKTLDEYFCEHIKPHVLIMPKRINWKALKKAYEFQPKNYEELVEIKGIGPATVRGLALISDLIYGEPPCFKDPVKYSFAYGGKDGVPYPVDRRAMDESIQFLKDVISQIKMEDKEKSKILKKLKNFAPKNIEL